MSRTRRHSAHYGTWAFLVLVGNLILTDAVNREFRVDRVTLMHRDKLPRVRRRLGLGAPVSEVKRKIRGWDFFEGAPAFASVRHTGTPEDTEGRCLELVREELSILAAAQLGYSKRGQMQPVALAGEDGSSLIQYLGVSAQDATWFGNLFKRTDGASNIALDGRWKRYQDNVFFTKLLRILRGDTEVTASWREELRRASIMIGESVGSNDLLKSFVWNMVVLEMLLTKQQERLKETLPKRAEAFLGWVGFWETDGYEDRIKEVYSKRNKLLHSGRRDVTEKDLEFTDSLILNLLINLVSHSQLFGSKEDVIRFSTKVEAERILGVKPKVRPSGRKGFRFIGRL